MFRQPLFEVAPQVGVVLDDHDVARLAVVPVVGSHDVGFGQQVVDFGDRVFVRFGGAVGLFGVEREGQDHRERDFRVARTEGDGSVEVADQLLDDCQSQAAAALELGTAVGEVVERFEDGLLLVVGDFRPGVGDREGDVFGAGGRRSGLRGAGPAAPGRFSRRHSRFPRRT